VHWSGYNTTSLDIEVDPQCLCFGSHKSDFALERVEDMCYETAHHALVNAGEREIV
jgi:hypothetical protein